MYKIHYQHHNSKSLFVPKLNTIRVLLSPTSNLNWPLQQVNIKNAFPNGELEEKVFMTLSSDFVKSNEKIKACKL